MSLGGILILSVKLYNNNNNVQYNHYALMLTILAWTPSLTNNCKGGYDYVPICVLVCVQTTGKHMHMAPNICINVQNLTMLRTQVQTGGNVYARAVRTIQGNRCCFMIRQAGYLTNPRAVKRVSRWIT
jgi:hypothetical protein